MIVFLVSLHVGLHDVLIDICSFMCSGYMHSYTSIGDGFQVCNVVVWMHGAQQDRCTWCRFIWGYLSYVHENKKL